MKNILSFILLFAVFTTFAQEKGELKSPKISSQKKEKDKNAKDKNFNKPIKKEIDDFDFEEAPKLRFVNEFLRQDEDSTEKIQIIPVKESNPIVQEKVDVIDEVEAQIVEIEPYFKVQGSDDLIRGQSYFAVWDNKRKNPYNLKASEFDDVVPLKLYDVSEGREWKSPLEKGRITSNFGWRSGRWHEGVDLDLETGDPVYAPFDGIVRVVGWDGRGYGNYMILRHYNGLETIYGHLSKVNLEANTYIKAGDMIAWGGNTGRSSGSHLHFETLYEGNPFNPRNIFDFSPEKIGILAQEFILTSKAFDYLRGKSSIVYEYEEEIDTQTQIINVAWVKVKSGETLTEIANRNGMSIQEICKLNRLSMKSHLRVGQKLRIQ
jgi:murein DD-endopeptidase MepM/ murein hydrolase activator NlpD